MALITRSGVIWQARGCQQPLQKEVIRGHMTKGLFKSIKETFTSMQMKAKLTSQNHNLDTKYRLYRKLLICITFVSNVASNFAGKMKVFRLTGYQGLQAKPNLLDPHASPSFYKTSFTN